jgi:biopolymer transport protein ExbD
MRFRTILCLATFFLSCFTVAVWSQPLPVQLDKNSSNPTVENQFLSGKISSVGNKSFAVDVVKNHGTQQTVELLMNDKTEVQGTLTIGAQVTVEYRADDGKNVALRVVET